MTCFLTSFEVGGYTSVGYGATPASAGSTAAYAPGVARSPADHSALTALLSNGTRPFYANVFQLCPSPALRTGQRVRSCLISLSGHPPPVHPSVNAHVLRRFLALNPLSEVAKAAVPSLLVRGAAPSPNSHLHSTPQPIRTRMFPTGCLFSLF